VTTPRDFNGLSGAAACLGKPFWTVTPRDPCRTVRPIYTVFPLAEPRLTWSFSVETSIHALD